MLPERFAGPEGGTFIERGDLPAPARLIRALIRGTAESFALVGQPGSGKSAVLRAWERAAREEGSVLPLSFAVPAAGMGLAAVALAALGRFGHGCLAYRGAEGGDAGDLGQLLERLRSAWPEAADVLAGTARRLELPAEGRSPCAEVSLVPGLLARATGVPVLLLCDDLENLARLGPAGLAVWPATAGPGRAATVFACREGSPLAGLLGPRAAAMRTLRLGPLPPDAAEQLFRRRAAAAGIELGEEARQAAVALAGGRPRYLEALVRALEDGPAAATLDVARAYGASVADGELGTTWSARLAEAIPSRPVRGVALEVLACCLRDGADPQDAGRLAAQVFRREEEVEAALEGLVRAGVARIDCRLVRVDPDPVLRDAVRGLHRREFGGASPGAVAALATKEAVRFLAAAAAGRAAEEMRTALRAILESWDGRSVPVALFDAAAFAASGAAGPGADGDAVSLPRVAAAASGRIGISTSPAGLELDAVAWGWRGEPGEPDGEVAWAVRCLPGGAAAAAAIREFDRAVAALQAAGDLPPARVVRWAILAAPPDAAGAAAAADLRVATSTPAALRALAATFRLGVRVPDFGHPPRPAELEVEMTLPAAADAELVAARALEQIAEMASLGEDEARRVRTALVEACINAFEHGGVPGGRVRLVFTVTAEELRIRVENRGRPFAPGVSVRPEGGEGRRRGWGLRLMRELMDSVELEAREDGVTLVMAKRLAGAGSR